MKKLALALVFGFFTAGFNAAAETFDLNSAAFSKQLNAATREIPVPQVQPPVQVKAKTGRYVQVSGYVTLNGNGWMPQNGGFTSVTLTGWGTFRDASGQITSNNTYINAYASMWLYPNQHVFQTVRPNVYAQFFRNGKPLGSTSMTGSVSVSGWPSSGFVTLNGSGYISGSLYVEEEK